MYNRVILMGRICHNLELKTTPNGIPVLSFRLAVERSYTPKGEDKKSDFFNAVAWRYDAEFISKYFDKGRMILIEGELQTREYTDKDNINRIVTEVIINKANFTGEPKPNINANNNNQPNTLPPAPPPQPAASKDVPQEAEQGYLPPPPDDEYPF